MLGRLLSYDDLEWAGIRQAFQVLFEKVRELLSQDELLCRDTDEHMAEINDYVML